MLINELGVNELFLYIPIYGEYKPLTIFTLLATVSVPE
jgi:hypothetical protein